MTFTFFIIAKCINGHGRHRHRGLPSVVFLTAKRRRTVPYGVDRYGRQERAADYRRQLEYLPGPDVFSKPRPVEAVNEAV